jgi:hypothetical protein
MIVIASKNQVFGPFQDANEALHWCRRHARLISEAHQPLVIQDVASPDYFNKDWRVRTLAEATSGR